MTTLPECNSKQMGFRGWNGCYLENGYIRLVAVPDIGGRVMAYDLGPHPFFFVDPALAGKLFTAEEHQGDGSLAAWKNYGGDKTWPAPQGWDNDQQWHGPPDPILDSGRYTLNEMSSHPDSATVSMTSPPDPRTGVQITREFRIQRGSSRVHLIITFKNSKDTPIRWSLWDVVQLRAEKQTSRDGDAAIVHDESCLVTTPLNPNSKFPRGYNVMFGAEDNPQWNVQRDLFSAQYLWQIGKVGLDSPGGWIAFSFNRGWNGLAFSERFDYDANGEYPDDGATVEVWTVGAGEVGNLNYEDSGIYLMETEVLSPMQDIAPGECAQFAIEWGSCLTPREHQVKDVTAGGCLTAPLAAFQREDGFYELYAGGGVFDAGTLRLVWRDANGAVIEEHPLAEVDPLAAVEVSRFRKPPEGAAAVELRVKAAASGQDTLWTSTTLG